MKKIYLLDTNVLMRSPTAIFNFEDNDVVICNTTLQELDDLKTRPGEVGFNAREAIRTIYAIQKDKDDLEKMDLMSGGTFGILEDSYNYALNADDRIINKALEIDATLVTSDIAMYLKARTAKCKVETYKYEAASESTLEYLGRREVFMPKEFIDAVYKEKVVEVPKELFAKGEPFEKIYDNEYCIIKDDCGGSSSVVTRYYKGQVKQVNVNTLFEKAYKIKPRNVGQICALDALFAPVDEIPLVFLIGPAGTAKTFLSMAAGLHQVKETKDFMRMLILRPNIKFDEDIGYLKGDEMDKITPLIRPCLDNLEAVLTPSIESSGYARQKVDRLFAEGVVEAEALAYIRGRSIANNFVVVDEAQNSTPSQMLGILTRTSLGTKIVVTGDPDQIDNPRVDKKNNGLLFAAEKMMDSNLAAMVGFTNDECVRSKLAAEAAKRLSL